MKNKIYKISRIAILILYPFLVFVLPIFLIGMFAFSVGPGGNGESNFFVPSVLISGVFSVTLLVFAVYYMFYATKHKLFSKKADGKRDAGVADYFAMLFSILAIIDVILKLLELLT